MSDTNDAIDQSAEIVLPKPHPFAPALMHLMLRAPRKRGLRQAQAALAAITPKLRKRARSAREAGEKQISITVSCIADLSEGSANIGYQAEFQRAIDKMIEEFPKSFKKVEVVLDYRYAPAEADILVVMDATFAAWINDDGTSVLLELVGLFRALKQGAVLAYFEPMLTASAQEMLDGTARGLLLSDRTSGIEFANLEAWAADALLENVDLSELDFSGYKLDYPVDALRAAISCSYSMHNDLATFQVTNGKVRLNVDGAVSAKKIDDFQFQIPNVPATLLAQAIEGAFSPEQYSYSQLWFNEGGKWAGDSFAVIHELDQLDDVTLSTPRVLHLFQMEMPDSMEGDALDGSVSFDAAEGGAAAAPAAQEGSAPRDIWEEADDTAAAEAAGGIEPVEVVVGVVATGDEGAGETEAAVAT